MNSRHYLGANFHGRKKTVVPLNVRRSWFVLSAAVIATLFFVLPSVPPASAQGSPPGCPILHSPSNGTWTEDNTPTFEWENGANAENHRLLVDNDPDFGSPEIDVVVVGDNSYTVPDVNSLTNTTYYWKVIAVNAWGENESEVWVLDVLKERGLIYIHGVYGGFWSSDAVNGGGNGTENNPFVIKNWVVDASSGYGIHIRYTGDYFIIRNCLIENGRASYNKGIYLYNVSNGRVENCVVKNNYDGIVLYESGNNILVGNTVENNYWTGIALAYSSSSTIINNTVSNHRIGISLSDYSNSTIANNTVSNSSYRGILLQHSFNNILNNNTVSNNNDFGILLESSSDNCTLANNIVINNKTGITINGSSNAILENNTLINNEYSFSVEGSSLSHFIQDIDNSNLINGKPIVYMVGENNIVINQENCVGYLGLVNAENVRVENLVTQGILLSYVNNVLIENSVSDNSPHGIYLYSSSSVTLANSTLRKNRTGVALCSSSNNTLDNNIVDNSNDCGIYLGSSSGNTLTNNILSYGSYGIRLESSSNNTLENNIVIHTYLGIRLESSSSNNNLSNNVASCNDFGIRVDWSCNSNVLFNNTVENNDRTGIFIFDSSNNILNNNIAKNNFSEGIVIYNSPNHTVTNNNVENNGGGIYLSRSPNSALGNNIVKNNKDGISLGESPNSTLNNNTVENNSGDGIYLALSGNCTLANNIVINNKTGVTIYCSSNAILENNTLINNEYSFSVEGSSLSHFIQDIDNSNLINGKPIVYMVGENNIVINQESCVGYLGLVNAENVRVENLVLGGNGQGILLAYVNNGRIENNVFENNYSFGIRLWSSSNCTIHNNTVKNIIYIEEEFFTCGIYLDSSNNNLLSSNTVENSGYSGIYLNDSSNCTFINNSVSTSYYGIYIESSSNNNLIYHNFVYLNVINAYDESDSNAWDNGSEGNWWGDWQWEDGLLDANSDGVFENKRQVGESVYDNYPLSLVNPKQPENGATGVSSPMLKWTTPCLENYTVEVDDDPNFNSKEYCSTVRVQVENFSLQNTVSVTVTGLSLNTTYYWKVKAWSESFCVSTPVWEFTTLSPPSFSPPQLRLTETVITVDPSAFSLNSGDSLILIATLMTSDGLPLAGKTLTLTATAGFLSAAGGITDNYGQIRIAYTAPFVTAAENITITISFLGDTVYARSTGTSMGVVLPRLPISTTLRVMPASFTMTSGENLPFQAFLVSENGMPLSGKTIVWSVDKGSLSPSTNATDSLGRATIIYTAPLLTAPESVSITAFFAGDDSYGPSSSISVGTILPQPPKELDDVMKNVKSAWNMLEIPVENGLLNAIESAIASGNLGAVVSVTIDSRGAELSKVHERENILVKLREVVAGERVKISVESNAEVGGTVLIFLDSKVIPVGLIREVLVDNEVAILADDYADVLDPTNDNGKAEYLLLVGGRGTQILVSIPHFSTRIITVIASTEVPTSWAPPLAVIGIAIIAIILFFAFRGRVQSLVRFSLRRQAVAEQKLHPSLSPCMFLTEMRGL